MRRLFGLEGIRDRTQRLGLQLSLRASEAGGDISLSCRLCQLLCSRGRASGGELARLREANAIECGGLRRCLLISFERCTAGDGAVIEGVARVRVLLNDLAAQRARRLDVRRLVASLVCRLLHLLEATALPAAPQCSLNIIEVGIGIVVI